MVERYKPTVGTLTAQAYCAATPDGQYVKAEDYDALAARLAEAERLLLELCDEWPAIRRSTVDRGYAFLERTTPDSASVAKITHE